MEVLSIGGLCLAGLKRASVSWFWAAVGRCLREDWDPFINLETPKVDLVYAVCFLTRERESCEEFYGDADICFIPNQTAWVGLLEICGKKVFHEWRLMLSETKDSHQRGSEESPDPALSWSFHAYEKE
jgi:hypothetical protein